MSVHEYELYILDEIDGYISNVPIDFIKYKVLPLCITLDYNYNQIKIFVCTMGHQEYFKGCVMFLPFHPYSFIFLANRRGEGWIYQSYLTYPQEAISNLVYIEEVKMKIKISEGLLFTVPKHCTRTEKG